MLARRKEDTGTDLDNAVILIKSQIKVGEVYEWRIRITGIEEIATVYSDEGVEFMGKRENIPFVVQRSELRQFGGRTVCFVIQGVVFRAGKLRRLQPADE